MHDEDVCLEKLLDNETLKKFSALSANNASLPHVIGTFIILIGHVEVYLDWLLTSLEKPKDFEDFRRKTKKRKLFRKAEIIREHLPKSEPDFLLALEHFDVHVREWRNLISHHMIGSRGDQVAFGSIESAWNVEGEPVRPNGLHPTYVSYKKLVDAAIWMKEFIPQISALAIKLEQADQ